MRHHCQRSFLEVYFFLLFIHLFIHISLLIFSRNHSSSSPGASFWQLQKQTTFLLITFTPVGISGAVLLEMFCWRCSTHSLSALISVRMGRQELMGEKKGKILILISSPLPPDLTVHVRAAGEGEREMWDGCCAKNEVSIKEIFFHLKIFAGFVHQMGEKHARMDWKSHMLQGKVNGIRIPRSSTSLL